MLQMPIFGKSGPRRIRLAAHQLLTFITCAALILHSIPITATAQGLGIGGLGVGSQQQGEGGGLLQLPLGRNVPLPEPARPAEPEGLDTNSQSSVSKPSADLALGTTNALTSLESTLSTSQKTALADEIRFALERRRAIVPEHEFDPEALATHLGPNPATLAAWVRNKTSLLPYRGVLKDAEGVLRDRQANSLDRSLLLLRMLAFHGFKARLVQTEISARLARQLLEQASGVAENIELAKGRLDVALLVDQISQNTGVDGALILAFLDAARTSRARQKETAVEVYKRISEPLLTIAMDARALPREELVKIETKQMIAALRDHWSVEIEIGSDWVRLPLVDFETLPEPRATFSPATLPNSIHHRVDLAMKISFNNGPIEEIVSLSLSASELAKQQVTIGVFPADPQAETSLVGPAAPIDLVARTLSRLIDEKPLDHDFFDRRMFWLPVISLGNNQFAIDKALDPAGSLISAQELLTKASAQGQAAESVGGGILGIASGGRLSPPETLPMAPFSLWLEITSHTPGREAQVSRRIWAYSKGGGADVGLSDPNRYVASMSRIRQVYVSTGKPLEGFLAHDVLRDQTAQPEFNAFGAVTSVGKSALFSGFEYNRWIALRNADAVFLDRPNLSIIEIGATTSGELQMIFDVVENHVAVRPNVALDPFLERARQGIADTVAESIFLDFDDPLSAHANSALSLYSALVAQSSDASLTEATEKDHAFLHWTRETAKDWKIMRHGMSTGNAEFAWMIDLNSGKTVGVDAMGRGATTLEYLSEIVGAAMCAKITLDYGRLAFDRTQQMGARKWAGVAATAAGFCAAYFALSLTFTAPIAATITIGASIAGIATIFGWVGDEFYPKITPGPVYKPGAFQPREKPPEVIPADLPR